MQFLANPSSAKVREAMSAGLIGCMTTPSQGNRIPDGAEYACDNGKFGNAWRGANVWWSWLQRKVREYGAERCLWAVAPDVPFDAAGTLEESAPWLPLIRSLGIPAAFAVQNGAEEAGMVPWDDFDVLFLAGDTDWKLGPHAAALTREAKRRGMKVHMGRVNSWKRFSYAQVIGCDSADGTCVAKFPDVYGPRVISWSAQNSLFDLMEDAS